MRKVTQESESSLKEPRKVTSARLWINPYAVGQCMKIQKKPWLERKEESMSAGIMGRTSAGAHSLENKSNPTEGRVP